MVNFPERWGERKYDPVCTFPGCNRPHKSKGYCKTHYEQLRTRGYVSEIRSWTKRSSVCKFPGCDKEHHSGGFCSAHYTQRQRRGHMWPVADKLKNPVCSFPGCQNMHSAKGLCKAHRDQQRVGIPLRPIKHHKARRRSWSKWKFLQAYKKRGSITEASHAIGANPGKIRVARQTDFLFDREVRKIMATKKRYAMRAAKRTPPVEEVFDLDAPLTDDDKNYWG